MKREEKGQRSRENAPHETTRQIGGTSDKTLNVRQEGQIAMGFAPAGEFIGDAHQVRTVGLRDSRQLPDGDYRFVDMYCTDPSCDCRKTMIVVYRNDEHVSTINFGWESNAFYREWMGTSSEDDNDLPMSGASIDITSPDGVSPRGMLAFFQALLNENWIAKFKTHYAGVKTRVAKKGQKKKGRRTR